MDRPSFQFYPGDWQRNAKLKRCTHAEKGIWVDVLCLLHDSDEYGVVRWPLKDVAQAVGCKLSAIKELVAKQVIKGADKGDVIAELIYTPRHAGKAGHPVTLLPAQNGPLWYSSRMVRDEYIRSKRGEGTRFGDEPKATPMGGMGDTPKAAPTHREGDGASSAFAFASATSTTNPTSKAVALSATDSAPAIAEALRHCGMKISAMHPEIQRLAGHGVGTAIIVEAHRIAVQDRGKTSPAIGYLLPIINDLRTAGTNWPHTKPMSATMRAIMTLENMKTETTIDKL